MKTFRIALLFCICSLMFSNLSAQWEHSPNWHWAIKARSYGEIAPLDMLTDKNNKQWLTGFYVGDAEFGNMTLHNNSTDGYYDIFLATEQNGNWLSVKSYGDSSAEQGRALCMDSSGNIYLLAAFFSDSILIEGEWIHNTSNSGEILLMKYQPDGSFMWVKHFGGDGWDQAYTMKLSSDNHIWIGGDFNGSILPLGNDTLYQSSWFGNLEAFVARLDTNGNVDWARSFYSGNNESLWKLAPLPGGKMAAAFVSVGSELTVCPYTLSDPYAENFLAAFDSTGETLWAKSIQCTGTSDIASDKNGNIFFASEFPYDSIFVDGQVVHARLDVGWTGSYLMASFDSSGMLKWAHANFADYYLDYTHLLTDDSGYVYLYGIPRGIFAYYIAVGDSQFIHEGVFFFAKSNPANGQLIWRIQNDNTTYSSETITASVDPDSKFTVAGAIYLPGVIQFGNDSLTYTNTGDMDMLFMARFTDTLLFIGVDNPTVELSSLLISPNPFVDDFSVVNHHAVEWYCKIYSSYGREVKSFTVPYGVTNISTSDLASGLYIAEFSNQRDKRTLRTKLVKQ